MIMCDPGRCWRADPGRCWRAAPALYRGGGGIEWVLKFFVLTKNDAKFIILKNSK